MKKLLIFLLLFYNNNIYAIENIEINNEYLVPRFDKSIKEYNYYTTSNKIVVDVKGEENEIIYGSGEHFLEEGKNTIEIKSSNMDKYNIKVFKNYNNSKENGYLKELKIVGYDIKYNKDVHEYFISIDNEEYLDIKYTLSNDNTTFSISGNGNFNKSDNIVKIKANNDEYILHVLKSISVSHINEDKEVEMSKQKKEIVILIIATISCSLVFLYYYLLFIFN